MPLSPRRGDDKQPQPQLRSGPYGPPAPAHLSRAAGAEVPQHLLPDSEAALDYDYDGLSTGPLPSYSQLLFWHAVALLPSILFILAFALLAFRIPCHLPHLIPGKHSRSHNGGDSDNGEVQSQRQRCAAQLGPASSLGWALFALAIFAYAAVHALRTALSQVCAVAFRLAQYTRPRASTASYPSYEYAQAQTQSRPTIVFACLGRALFTETAKVGLVLLGSALVYASSALRSRSRSLNETAPSSTSVSILTIPSAQVPDLFDSPQWTKISAHDPRLRIAAWLALGWAVADFARGTAQLFRQLAMYAPVYLSDAARDEEYEDEGEGEEEEEGPPWLRSSRAPHAKHGGVEPHVEAQMASPYGSAFSRAHVHGSSRLARMSAYRGDSDSIYRGREDDAGPPSPSLSPEDEDEDPDARRRASTSDIPVPTGSLSPASSPHASGSGNLSVKQNSPFLASASAASASLPPGHPPPARPRTYSTSPTSSASSSSSTTTTSSSSSSLDLAELTALDLQIDRLVAARTRARLEHSLGIALPLLPCALAALWRLDSALWSVGGVLLLAGGVALGQGGVFSAPGGEGGGPEALQPQTTALLPTYAALILLHAGVNALWAIALPAGGRARGRGFACGWAALTYSSLLAGIGILVAALARWGLVV